MLSQRHHHPKIQNESSKVKNAKPFSLLSIGLSKMPGLHNKHRTWDMQDLTQPIKHKKQVTTNNENKDISQNTYQVCVKNFEDTPQESIYPHLANLSTTLMQVEQHHASQLNQDVIFTDQKISFQSVSNLMADGADFLKAGVEKENCNLVNLNLENRQKESQQKQRGQKLVVNLKKKIKKLNRTLKIASKPFNFEKIALFDFEEEGMESSHLERESLSLAHSQFMSNPFSDRQVYPDSYIYRSQIISQRIDNDVDSDQQQVTKGIQRLHKFLSDTIVQQQTTTSYR